MAAIRATVDWDAGWTGGVAFFTATIVIGLGLTAGLATTTAAFEDLAGIFAATTFAAGFLTAATGLAATTGFFAGTGAFAAGRVARVGVAAGFALDFTAATDGFDFAATGAFEGPFFTSFTTGFAVSFQPLNDRERVARDPERLGPCRARQKYIRCAVLSIFRANRLRTTRPRDEAYDRTPMVRLSREVRFNLSVHAGAAAGGGTGHGGTPAAEGPAVRWAVRVTLSGEPDPASGYLIDIRRIDEAVRQRAFAALSDAARGTRGLPGTAADTFDLLRHAWPGQTLERVELIASDQQQAAANAGGRAMTELSQHFEFSAAHRLHNPALGDDENRRVFGKCNNPAGHGHNYEVRVTLVGTPDATGRLIGVAELEGIVETHAIDKLDHKHLNEQVPAFATVNPSVENIARVIFDWLVPALKREHAALKSVTVWETPKTSCEYSGPIFPG